VPTRKQKRRELKAKRHEYETVWVDAEGNELDEVPPEAVELEEKKKDRTAAKATAAKQPPQRGGRRQPQPPSWNRATKRGLLLGLVVFAMFGLTSKGKYVQVLPLALIYTVLFIPFTYYIDRFAYKRFQARTANGGGTTPRPAKKR
jgi:cation transport ATPase